MKNKPTRTRNAPTPADVRTSWFTALSSCVAVWVMTLTFSRRPFWPIRADCVASALAAGVNSRASNFRRPATRKTTPKSSWSAAINIRIFSVLKNIRRTPITLPAGPMRSVVQEACHRAWLTCWRKVWIGIQAVAVWRISSRMCARSISAPSQSKRARSSVLRSSRILPGQRYDFSALMTRGRTPVTSLP